MKRKNGKRIVLLSCLLLVVGVLFLLTSCGACTDHTFGDWETVKAPTCTDAGERQHACKTCGVTVKESIAALGHDTEKALTTPPTCTADGVETTTCKREGCDYRAISTVNALGHDKKTEVTVAATCDEDGVETTTCGREGCTYRTTAAIAKLGHDLTTVQTSAPTCMADGVETTTCRRAGCTYSSARTVAKLAHTPDREAATCTAAKVCTMCHTVLEAKKAHTLSETTVPPSCTEGGYTKVACSGCDYENITATTAALAHTPDIPAPTCTEDQTCTVCHGVLAKKTGRHAYDVIESREADCEHDGYELRQCADCGETLRTVTAPALQHSVAAWTEDVSARVLKNAEDCTYTLTYRGECSRCGTATRTEDKVLHTFESRVSRVATCTTPGEKTLTCTKCGASGGTQSYEDSHAHAWVVSQVGEDLVSHCNNNCGTPDKKSHNAQDKSSTTVPSTVLNETDSVKLKDAEIALDETVKSQLGDNTELTAETLSDEVKNDVLNSVSAEMKEKIGNSTIYNFGLSTDGTPITNFGAGRVTVTIPYTLAEGEDPESIAVFYVDADGGVKSFAARYANGFATFEAEHFSYYTVARLTPAERCKVYNHTYIEEDIPVTCTVDGCHLKVCRRCGLVERTDIVVAPGHWLNEGEITRPATCLENGVITVSCARENCGYHFEIAILALGHSFVTDAATSTAATCTKTGTAHFVCEHEGCDADYTLTLPKTAHTVETKTVPVTCTTDGYTLNTCSVCGLTYRTGERAALGHKMTETVVPATCTEDGYTLNACRSCDYSFRTDTVAKHHTFDIAEPTCGQGQICTLCGAKGLPATGKHTMVDGVCSVCGQGCTHDFGTVTKAPTCTEGGYDEKTCKICGTVVRENYTKKLGHDYKNGTCTRCGDRLDLSNLYYQINRSLLTTRYTYLAKNVKLVIYDEDFLKGFFGGNAPVPPPNTDTTSYAVLLGENETVPTPDIAVTFSGELYFGFDENGELFGTMIGELSGTVSGEVGKASIAAVLKDGKIYAKTEIKEPTPTVATVTADLKKLTERPTGDTMNTATAYAFEMLKWYEEDVLPLLLSVADKNADDIAAMTERFLGTFFKMEDRAEGGYTFTFDFDKLHALNDVLAEKKISEVIDLYFGEGAFDRLKSGLPALFDMTFGDLFDAMEARGVAVNDLIDLVNALLARLRIPISEDMTITTLDQLLTAMIGEEISAKEFFASEQFRTTNVSDLLISFLSEKTGREINKETLLSMIGDMLENMKNHTVYTLIASLIALPEGSEEMTEEEIAAWVAEQAAQRKERVDLIIETLRGALSCSFTVDADGTFDGFILTLNAENSEIGSLYGQILAVKGYQSSIDVDAILNAAAPPALTPHSADGEDGFELVFDEKGELSAIVVERNNLEQVLYGSIKDDNYATVGEDENGKLTNMPETIRIRFSGETNEFTFRISDLLSAMYTSDCAPWISVNYIFTKYASARTYSCEKSLLFKTEEVAKLLGCTVDTLRPDKLIDNLPLLLKSDLACTIVTDAAGEPRENTTGTHCDISFCYNPETKAIKNVSGMHETVREYTFATDTEDCTAGVTETVTCIKCNLVVGKHTYKRHDFCASESFAPAEHGAGSCGISAVVFRSCLCGKVSEVHIDGDVYGMEESRTEIEGGERIVTLYRCRNEDCNAFFVRATEDIITDGCIVRTETTYELVAFGTTVKTLSTRKEETRHVDLRESAELLPGAASCSDGVLYRKSCTVCGFSEEEEIYYHKSFCKKHIDLAEIGSLCGGKVDIIGCACGFEGRMEIDTACDFVTRKEPELIVGNCTEAYTDTCSVTDCAFTILYKVLYDPDVENCTATRRRYAYIGWNRDTGEYKEEVLLSTDILRHHTCEDTSDADPTALRRTRTETCLYCGYRREETWTYRDAAAFEENGRYLRFERREYESDGSVTIELEENFDFADESDPRYEILQRYGGYYKLRRHEWQKDGKVSYEESRVELDLENCSFRIVEDRDGATFDKGWISFHQAGNDPMMMSRFYEIEGTDRMTSCTTTVTWRIGCRFCGASVNPFGMSADTPPFFIYSEEAPAYGMPDDRFYRARLEYILSGDVPTDNDGMVFVNPASYDEATGTFLVACGHNYQYDSDMQTFVCARCHLKNATGRDAVAVLRDATKAGDAESGRYTAEFFRLTTARLMPHLSLVVVTTDAESGERIEKIVYLDTETFAREYHDEDFVTVTDTVITVDFAALMNFVAANGSEELKTLLATAGGALCRLNIVPEGGSLDLECAITFE